MAKFCGLIGYALTVETEPGIYEDFYFNLSKAEVTEMGAKWKITDVEVQYPRLLLTIGGLYNE